MTVLERIRREPANLLAFATAVLAVLTGTGTLTAGGATIALSVVAAAIGLLSYIVTPASEVVVQDRPGIPGLIAGRGARKASDIKAGARVEVETVPVPD